MVCIAAFIILGLIGVFVAIISIFKKDFGRAYWKALKKAAGCVGKKVRLQKCDTNFKDDVKNTLLKKIILKHPKWVRPLSIIIEALSIIFVIVFVWAVLTAIKSLLALWALGTCNVTKPSACSLGAEVCSLGNEDDDANLLEQTGRWFTEWGDIFAAIPDRLKNWDTKDYLVEPITFVDASVLDGEKSAPGADAPYALDLLDPGCSACMMSFRNQLESGFFETHKTALLVYPIKVDAENYKFKNSDLIARYFYAAALLDQNSGAPKYLGLKLIHKIFTGKTASGALIQSHLASLEYDEAKAELKAYLKEFGATDGDLKEISKLEKSDDVKNILAKVEELAKNQIKITGIPTLIYDGKKHLGLYETK
ncbi:hypothetical protein IKL45_00630 [Candidatus Saccharibacteria bacterium]|nr:hypothetical protein [Candidatus Saccharibacteria bacterium]MBR6122938.1 hypothetical protein [Candidatus Saccharibacteria bacterium]